MRLRASTALASLAALAAAACGSSGALAGESVTKLGVRAVEFDLTLTRARVDPGPAEVEYVNAGEDPHDLRIRRRGSERVFAIPELESGDPPAELDLRFRRDSRYVFWCSTLGGQHRAQGMEAELRVRRG